MITTSATAAAGEFKVLMGDGGLGFVDACTPESTSVPQYLGTASKWGNLYGGALNETACGLLPEYPTCRTSDQDNLQDLCRWSFRSGFRIANQSTIPVTKMCPVACPSHLVLATGLQRMDESANLNCLANGANVITGGSLGSYMDCGAPAYANAGSQSIIGEVNPAYSFVNPCRRDGYTRISSFPNPTGVPVSPPASPAPTSAALTTNSPAGVPDKEMCCSSFSYADYDISTCYNPADKSLGDVASCATCVSYFCLDWLPGSQEMIERESLYFNNTNDKVYFGFGAYGFESSRGGYCYRLTVDSIDRDIIVQVIHQAGSAVDGDFDLYMAGGGLGNSNACTVEGSTVPQYLSTESQWGDLYGGWPTREQCEKLPKYPACGRYADNLQNMCKWSFDKGLRLQTQTNYENSNPTISKFCQVTIVTLMSLTFFNLFVNFIEI